MPSTSILSMSSEQGSKVAACSYIVLCLTVLGFSYLNSINPWRYDVLAREDGGIENLTAVLFLLAGLLLGATAMRERRHILQGLYILGGLALVFVAGEEVSWGQRIFGWTTPEFLQSINIQGELNVHNINTDVFGKLHRESGTLLCIVAGVAFIYRQNQIFGIPLPSFPLLCGFLLTQLYGLKTPLVSSENGLLLLLGIAVLRARQPPWIMIVVTTSVLNLALQVIYGSSDGIRAGRFSEGYECLSSIAVCLYAFQLWQGTADRTPTDTVFEPEAKGEVVWLVTCSLVIIGSVGWVWRYQSHLQVEVAAVKETYQAIVSGGVPAVAYAEFDVYLTKNRLIYVKEPCTAADVDLRFVLHLVPVTSHNLPRYRWQSGFDNLDHEFDRHGTRMDGICLTSIPLPEYSISRIRIGQRYPSGSARWRAEFSHPANVAYGNRQTDNIIHTNEAELAISSYFNVYVNRHRKQIVYIRNPCDEADIATRFFLHVTPVFAADLPISRRSYGFDNLDFDFHKHEIMADGQCMAKRTLPDYDIASIHTGQYTETGNLWKVRAKLDP